MSISLKLLLFSTIIFNVIIFPQKADLDSTGERFILELMQKMTPEEKIGQLVQSVGMNESREVLVKECRIGSVLIGLNGAEYANRIQKIAVEETRLGIPLLFANDVLHGYRTTFPVPLGSAASWHPELVKEACSIAAFEAASEGTHWTYAPMIDIARDPRWGRIMEGAGEDPYLGSVMAAAQIQGYQGKNIADKNSIASCAKHYVAYGAAEGGRDYNTTDMSERTLREVYLKPFYAAVENDAASIMSAFNDLNGVPASANYFTLTQILRNEWKWRGVVVSDYNSIGELVKHRIASDKKQAALEGLTAGVDIDMVGDSTDGNVYSPYLLSLLNEGTLDKSFIDRSVKRVLEMKYKLGLFNNPYTDTEYYKNNDLKKEYKDSIALQLARESIVLLKNDNSTLPVSNKIKRIAVIGPLADDSANVIGGWSAAGKPSSAVTILQGIKNRIQPGITFEYVKGCEVNSKDTSGFAEAFSAASKADMVLLFIGESEDMSGEAGSRSDLNLPGMQEALAKRINASGKPVVAVVFSGRPLTINWLNDNVPAIIEAWFPGSQAGNAIADVLFGRYNPSGKIPVTFPRSTGQIPVYYYHKNTGRPYKETDRFTSKYLDDTATPLFPFGYGLSYTTFKYDNIRTDKSEFNINDSIKIYFDLTNTGKIPGIEVAQLYIQDEAASISPAVKKLQGFQRISLLPGETKTLSFTITKEMLSFYNRDMKYTAEPGVFNIMAGGNSEALISLPVTLK
jgi:beta-glucosidase